MKFNEKLKSLREAKGYTQDEIASKLNIARQSVSKWEQGINEPDFETTKKLCQILDCSLADLIDSDKEIVTTKEMKEEKAAKTIFKFNIGLLVFAVLMTFAFAMAASETVTIHWGLAGNETLGSRWYTLINLFPIAVIAFITIFTRILTIKKERYHQYKIAFQIISLVVSAIIVILTFVMGILMIHNHNKGEYALINLLTAGALALITTIGPFTHPRFNKRNPVFGFRTNFTLSNEEGWHKVNAFASIALTIASAIGFVLTLIFIDKSWAVFFIASIIIMMIPTIIYHEIIRKRLR